jgi:choice-of-anchor B domain-containing protein
MVYLLYKKNPKTFQFKNNIFGQKLLYTLLTMKKIFIFLSVTLLIFLVNSCNTEDITRDIVEIVDDENNDQNDDNDDDDTGGDTGGDGSGGGSGGDEPSDYPIPCENGVAGSFICNGFDLINHITLSELFASGGNDCWGWTDPSSGKEYAIMGVDNGTVFVDISDPLEPVLVAKVLTETSPSSWRDVKVYNNHAFIVSEASGHGMQVFDLTRLANVMSPPEFLDPDAVYSEFSNAHNIVINEDTGFAYAVGTNTFGGGPHFINIQNPTSPSAAGGYAADGYSHDGQAVIYNGPDQTHVGKEIYFGSNETIVSIVDVSNKSNPDPISNILYSNTGYTHQGWLTEDHRYLIVGDELDELNTGIQTRTLVFDISDLDNPILHFEYQGPTFAIDHNGYVLNGKLYLANYTAGLRVLDLSSIDNQSMFEEGYFDTHIATDGASFNGAWSVYPFFSSGNIIISDINEGLFIVKKN